VPTRYGVRAKVTTANSEHRCVQRSLAMRSHALSGLLPVLFVVI
jgi:hypothetical protein